MELEVVPLLRVAVDELLREALELEPLRVVVAWPDDFTRLLTVLCDDEALRLALLLVLLLFLLAELEVVDDVPREAELVVLEVEALPRELLVVVVVLLAVLLFETVLVLFEDSCSERMSLALVALVELPFEVVTVLALRTVNDLSGCC